MKIDKEELLVSLTKDQVVVLNILPKGEFKKLHIKGSESHPLTEDLEDFSKEVAGKYGKAKSFILYGERFGKLDSFFATKALEDHGLKALNYSGGLREWHKAGLPVEGTEAVVEKTVVS